MKRQAVLAVAVLPLLLGLVFAANLIAGAYGGKPFIGDVGEMLVLLAAAVAFSAAALNSEAAANRKKQQ